MGLYNLQNICKILTPLFTLASSIDIHNLKSSFDPKHLWNHRISLSMGRKKKKEKAKRVGLFLSWSSKIRKISYFPFVQREKRNYTRTQDSKYFCYFLVYNLYIYICLSSHGEEYFFSNVSLSPFFAVFCSLLRPQETLLFAWHGVSKEPHSRQACPRILLPPFLRSNQAAWNRVIARTSAQLCFSSPCKSLLPPWDLRTRDRS